MKKSIKQYQDELERFKNLPYEVQRKIYHFSDYYILNAFLQILQFVDEVILTDQIKDEIFLKTHLDFFEREHLDEAGNVTIGIKTFWQLEKFVDHFNKQYEDFRERLFLQKVSEYNKLEVQFKKSILNKDLYAYSKFNLITGGNILTQKLAELAKIELDFQQGLNDLETGFKCNLSPDIVQEIYYLSENHIRGKLTDFQAIFSRTPQPVQNPVIWLVKRDNKPNKTALFTFLKMILELDEVSRKLLKLANQHFVFGKENIFPETYTYPSIESQRSSYLKHFKQIKQKYFPDFLKE